MMFLPCVVCISQNNTKEFIFNCNMFCLVFKAFTKIVSLNQVDIFKKQKAQFTVIWKLLST